MTVLRERRRHPKSLQPGTGGNRQRAVECIGIPGWWGGVANENAAKYLDNENGKYLRGLAFVSPLWWFYMFLRPFVQSIIFSFNQLELTPTGMSSIMSVWTTTIDLLFVHRASGSPSPETLVQMLSRVPAVLILCSFFAPTRCSIRDQGGHYCQGGAFPAGNHGGTGGIGASKARITCKRQMSYSKIGAELGMFSRQRAYELPYAAAALMVCLLGVLALPTACARRLSTARRYRF